MFNGYPPPPYPGSMESKTLDWGPSQVFEFKGLEGKVFKKQRLTRSIPLRLRSGSRPLNISNCPNQIL